MGSFQEKSILSNPRLTKRHMVNQWITGNRLRVISDSKFCDLEMTHQRLCKVKYFCIFCTSGVDFLLVFLCNHRSSSHHLATVRIVAEQTDNRHIYI